ncbi:MAG: Gldg family protein [Acidobacteria bacterium]|nr:Gldg family protein [Acidobacteriota bacterium]
MSARSNASKAIFRRELISYFSSPTGYVFITLFVFLSAIAAFWQNAFFENNLANLDPLNQVFPYLLIFFIPAITMAAWAEERRNGTDELLLTLPASDLDIVLGKYAAMLAIYTVSLVFSLSHVVVLLFLGRPDFGLIFSTYLGYWLMGAAMIALGMIGSLLTSNLTVAYIVGAVLCAIPVFLAHAGTLFNGAAERLIRSLSFVDQFNELASGVIPVSGVLYFVAFTAAMLYLNVALLGRRHWPTTKDAPKLGLHYWARGLALVLGVAALTVLAGRLGGRIDATAEGLHSVAPSTRALLRGLDSDKPVFITAYVSPEAPARYLETRNNIVGLLREFDSIGGDAVHARIVETEKYTPEAAEAQDRYNIRPAPIPPFDQTPGGPQDLFLGVAFRSGNEEFVIPYFEPGLPVEYELMRSIRVVSQAAKRKIGVLQTGVEMFGGFDFQNRRRTADWSILQELRKQYDVSKVEPGSDYPADLDVLLAVQPTTLEQAQVTRLQEYVGSGKPVLLMVDPLPAFNIELSPQQAPPSPFQQQPQKVPADLSELLDALGLEWPAERIVWDRYNPHPQFRNLPPEVTFISAQNGEGGFNPDANVTAGMQELVMLYGGTVKPKEGATTKFTPLLTSGVDSGTTLWFRLVQNTIFGVQLATDLPHEPDEERYVMAARVEGEGDAGAKAIVVADIDIMGEQFFQLRAQGVERLEFDNVSFLLNSVDALAGDDDFIELRKRRRRHRTLTTVEALTKEYEDKRLEDTRQAETSAEEQLQNAQKRLNDAVEAIRERSDLDVRTRQIMIANQEKIENRRLTVARKNIEDSKQRLIERSRADMESSIRNIQSSIKLAAVALSPIPAFLLFLFVSARRLRREQASVSRERLVHDGGANHV